MFAPDQALAAAARPQAGSPQQRLAEKPRFGINTLLNRMTGHSAEPTERVAPAMRQRPQVTAAFEDDAEVDPEQERVEIPAFLRRQAN